VARAATQRQLAVAGNRVERGAAHRRRFRRPVMPNRSDHFSLQLAGHAQSTDAGRPSGVAFALLSVLAVIYQRLGVLMLSTLGTDAQVAYLRPRSRDRALKILHFAVLGALLPALARLATQPDDLRQTQAATRLFRRSLLLLLGFSIVAALALIVLAQPIVPLLFGAGYAESVPRYKSGRESNPIHRHGCLSVRLVTQGKERRLLWATVIGLGAAGC